MTPSVFVFEEVPLPQLKQWKVRMAELERDVLLHTSVIDPRQFRQG
jgi:hypothetical protein